MAYIRKTRDVYRLVWNGEVIDEFYSCKEAKEMAREYNLAFHSGVSIRKGREKIEEASK